MDVCVAGQEGRVGAGRYSCGWGVSPNEAKKSVGDQPFPRVKNGTWGHHGNMVCRKTKKYRENNNGYQDNGERKSETRRPVRQAGGPRNLSTRNHESSKNNCRE